MFIPIKRLSRDAKEALIQQLDTRGEVARARASGLPVSVNISSTTGDLLVGADIHFTIEHRDPNDGLGWAGVFYSGASYSPDMYNRSFLLSDEDTTLSAKEQSRRLEYGVHPLGRLGRRDYDFFARLAGVHGDGPEPNGMPPDASVMTQRVVARWEGDGHSHGHMSLREFVKRKILDDNTLAEAAKSKLQGGDPIAEYLGDCVDDDNDITLDDNTRVVYWFDN